MTSSRMSLPNKRKMLLNHDWEITVAFQRDCELFLEKYEALASTNYSEFCKVWKEMNFTMVYSNLETAVMARDLVECMFLILKKFVTHPKNRYMQIGAFYMLYGLYYKQPIKNWIKIRLTLEEFKKFHEMISLDSDIIILEVLYMFAKLMQDDAFLFVATKSPMGFENRYLRNFNTMEDDAFQQRRSETAFSSFSKLMRDNSTLHNLIEADKKYEELKKDLPDICKGLLFSDKSIVTDLKQLYDKTFDISPGPSFDVTDDDDDDYDNFEEEEETIASKRFKLKQKAMATQNAVYRGKRKLLLKTDDGKFEIEGTSEKN